MSGRTRELLRPILAGGLAFGLLAGCAPSPAPGPAPLGPPPEPGVHFTSVDQNADDHVDQPEWESHGERTFDRLDADGSDSVTADEVNAGFDAFDLDGDGVLSPNEVDAAAFDLNEDGKLSREEWELANAHTRIDANGDGQIDRDEFRARRSLNFQRYDVNRDQRVSRIELSEDAPGFTLFRF